MSLNATEVAYARKLLARGEREWHHWAVVRWLVLLVGLVLLGGGVGAVILGQREPEELARAVATRPTPAVVTFATVQSEVALARTQLVAFAMQTSLFNALGIGLMATGVVALGYGLTHWNRHLRDALLCKAIREKFLDVPAGAAA